eukprot:RCo009198
MRKANYQVHPNESQAWDQETGSSAMAPVEEGDVEAPLPLPNGSTYSAAPIRRASEGKRGSSSSTDHPPGMLFPPQEGGPSGAGGEPAPIPGRILSGRFSSYRSQPGEDERI